MIIKGRYYNEKVQVKTLEEPSGKWDITPKTGKSLDSDHFITIKDWKIKNNHPLSYKVYIINISVFGYINY